MEAWICWVIAAVLLALLELLLSGFVLLCFAVASACTAFVSLLHARTELQIVSFITFTVASLVFIRPFFLKHMKPRGGLVETNVYGLIGKEALLIAEIGENSPGAVKVGGEEWGAVSQDGSPIAAGSKVRILAVSGNKLIVSSNDVRRQS